MRTSPKGAFAGGIFDSRLIRVPPNYIYISPSRECVVDGIAHATPPENNFAEREKLRRFAQALHEIRFVRGRADFPRRGGRPKLLLKYRYARRSVERNDRRSRARARKLKRSKLSCRLRRGSVPGSTQPNRRMVTESPATTGGCMGGVGTSLETGRRGAAASRRAGPTYPPAFPLARYLAPDARTFLPRPGGARETSVRSPPLPLFLSRRGSNKSIIVSVTARTSPLYLDRIRDPPG